MVSPGITKKRWTFQNLNLEVSDQTRHSHLEDFPKREMYQPRVQMSGMDLERPLREEQGVLFVA